MFGYVWTFSLPAFATAYLPCAKCSSSYARKSQACYNSPKSHFFFVFFFFFFLFFCCCFFLKWLFLSTKIRWKWHVSDFHETVSLFCFCPVMYKNGSLSSVSMSVPMATKIFYFNLIWRFFQWKCLYWDKLDWQCLARKVNDSYISQQPPSGTVYW